MFQRNYVHKSSLMSVGLLAFIAGVAAWAIFGKKATEELNSNPDFRDLKKQVYKKTSQISGLTREKYNEVVDEVAANYAKLKGISENELGDLVEDLKIHWRRMKDAWKE